MNKMVVIINGKGGVGKDTFCNFTEKIFNTMNISSINPIFDIAYAGGWNGIKDEKGRLLLSELKKIFNNYNGLTIKYILEQYKDFLKTNHEIMFIHIREPEEISMVKQKIKIPCIALLIHSDRITQKFGNNSDDDVEQYLYDYYFENSGLLNDMEQKVSDFWESLKVKML